MKQYEMIREIFLACSGNQKSKAYLSEIETDDLDEFVKEQMGALSICDKTVLDNGGVIYDVMTRGFKERYTFQEI